MPARRFVYIASRWQKQPETGPLARGDTYVGSVVAGVRLQGVASGCLRGLIPSQPRFAAACERARLYGRMEIVMQMKQQTLILNIVDIEVYSEEQTFEELAEQFPDDPFLCSQHFRMTGAPGSVSFRTR